MFKAPASPYLVPFDGSFRVARCPTAPPAGKGGKKANKDRLRRLIRRLDDLQRILYADNRFALLLIFQAMDAAGKDGTIRAVMRGVNPAGCQVFSFKQPTPEELEHDFLWRTHKRLPERGRIGIFNRSYYEEVLIVRVRPEFLAGQNLPYPTKGKTFWEERYESIQNHELHLARNGMVILKFWLNVSPREQTRRFLARLEDPSKNWKFSEGDLKERPFWDDYMSAYQDALAKTSAPWAPWYAVPADDKPFMRTCVSELIVAGLKKLPLSFPRLAEDRVEEFRNLRKELEEWEKLGD
jgi:PPK2 family polyphosphate:nucleotide phosphotransferase